MERLTGVDARKLLAGVLALQLCGSGCATVANGINDDVRIESVPNEADVEIRDHENQVVAQGRTPMSAELRRGSGWISEARYVVYVSKDGYRARAVPLPAGTSPFFYGNLVLGLGLGTIVFMWFDTLTGGVYDFEEVQSVTLATDVPTLVPEPESATRE